MQVQGVVSRVTSKDWQGTALYSFQLENDGRWFRTGRTPPTFVNGVNIAFDVVTDPRGNNNVDIHTVQQVAGGAAQAVPVSAVTQVSGLPSLPVAQGVSKDQYWNEKDRYDKEIRQPAIEYQAARNAAIALVSAMLVHEALPGITKTANAAKRAEVIEATVDQYTEKFFSELPYKMPSYEEVL